MPRYEAFQLLPSQIRAQFLAKMLPGAMDDDRHQHLGNVQHLRNLRIAEALKEAQGKNLRRPGLKLSQRATQRLAQGGTQFFFVAVCSLSGQVREFGDFYDGTRLSGAKHIEGGIDRCPAQVTLLISTASAFASRFTRRRKTVC